MLAPGKQWGRGVIPAGTDLDDWWGPEWGGHWEILNAAGADSVAGLPVSSPGTLEVWTTSNGVATQIFTAYGAYSGVYFRQAASVGDRTWTTWARLATIDDVPSSPGSRNEMLAQTFTYARGGRIGTGGVSAVALRFDHGTVNFRDIVLPLLRKYGLPCTQAYYSEMFTTGRDPESNTDGNIGWNELQQWALEDGVEPAAHSATHRDAATSNAMNEEIVESLADLRAAIPRASIDGFLIPGVGGTGYAGFNSSRLTDFTDTPAGQRILATYAWASGYHGGQVRSLDGTLRSGLTHYTWESQSLGFVQSYVRNAQDLGGGIVLMMHPMAIDTPGNVTAAQVDEVLGWIAAERDAGRLEVLTVGGLAMADTGTTHRQDLIRSSALDDATAWGGTSGWTISGGEAVSTSDGGLLQQSLALSRVGHVAGHPREIRMTVTAPTGAVVRVEAAAGDWVAAREVELLASGDPVTVRQPFTIPAGTGGNLTLHLGRVSGGPVTMTDPHCYAI